MSGKLVYPFFEFSKHLSGISHILVLGAGDTQVDKLETLYFNSSQFGVQVGQKKKYVITIK